MLTVTVDGATRLARALLWLATDLDDLRAMKTLADRGASLARGYAPRRSGRLASTVEPQTRLGKASVIAGAGIKYAGVQNYGWAARNIPATSFMQRADAALRGAATPLIESSVSGQIKSRGL